MATKKTSATNEPKIVRGSHSTRTEYPDGRVEFVTHWDELVRDVQEALSKFESTVTRVVEVTEEKVKKTRAKKEASVTESVSIKKSRKSTV